jgi:hypothetical protein
MRKVYAWYMSEIYLSYVFYLDINQVYVRYMCPLYLAVGAAVVGTAPYRLNHRQ